MIQNLSIRHGLQSDEWMLFQKALGKHVIGGQGNGWQVNAVVEGSDSKMAAGLKRLYAPYGPFAASVDAMGEALDFLKKTAKSQGVDYIRIEPTQYFSSEEMESFGCVKATNDFQPGLTNVADLTKSEDDLIAVMDYEMRRLNRQLEQRGFSFEMFYDTDNMNDFLTMMQLTSSRAQAIFREADYLKTLIKTLGPTKHAGILYALNQGKRLSGVLFFDDLAGKTRYYMYAGSLDEARKVNGNAAALLHLFFDAKNIGMERFDFFGVSPIEYKNHRWAGFSKFKRDFGGIDVQFSGTWELPINKTRYKLMNSLRGLAKR